MRAAFSGAHHAGRLARHRALGRACLERRGAPHLGHTGLHTVSRVLRCERTLVILPLVIGESGDNRVVYWVKDVVCSAAVELDLVLKGDRKKRPRFWSVMVLITTRWPPCRMRGKLPMHQAYARQQSP